MQGTDFQSIIHTISLYAFTFWMTPSQLNTDVTYEWSLESLGPRRVRAVLVRLRVQQKRQPVRFPHLQEYHGLKRLLVLASAHDQAINPLLPKLTSTLARDHT